MSADWICARQWLFVFLAGFLSSRIEPIQAQDVFDTQRAVPMSAASPILGDHPCLLDPPTNAVTLNETIERTLCSHPKARQAWAEVKGQAAATGVATAAFLPTITVSGQEVRDQSRTIVNGDPFLNSHLNETTYSASASLSWLIYDFGGREAAQDNADESLAAALYNHSDVLRTLFLSAAKDYYSALAAQGARDAAVETERSASNSFDVATRRVERGISPVSDQLQAETAYYQARVLLQKADGDWHTAMGVLASDMSLRPDTEYTLVWADVGDVPEDGFDKSVSSLIDNAVARHPKVLMAESQLKVADAAVRQARAAGLPSVSLIAKSSRNNTGVAAAQGLPLNPATTQDNYVGVQVSIPLFEGFARNYKVRQAEAQKEAQGDMLDEVRRQVSLEVWNSFHAVVTATHTLGNSSRLLTIANRSYVAASRRYETGAGSILELLNTQSALANAKREKIQAIVTWHSSRLDLAEKLGSLEFRDIYEGMPVP